MPNVYLKIDPVPSEKAGGINLDIGVCRTSGKEELCEMVDRLEFDKKDVARAIPQQVVDMISKSVSGEYWEEGCKRLGEKVKADGKCGTEVFSGDTFRTYTPAPKEKN